MQGCWPLFQGTSRWGCHQCQGHGWANNEEAIWVQQVFRSQWRAGAKHKKAETGSSWVLGRLWPPTHANAPLCHFNAMSPSIRWSSQNHLGRCPLWRNQQLNSPFPCSSWPSLSENPSAWRWSTSTGLCNLPSSHHHEFLTGIAPFYLYPCLDKPWMCPVRLFAEWWVLSGRTRAGFVFRKKIGSRFSIDPFQCMVSDLSTVWDFQFKFVSLSVQNPSWSVSGRISVILVLTLVHMVPTHSAVDGANTWLWCSDGPFETYALGVGGPKTLTTLEQYSNTSSRGRILLYWSARIILTQTAQAVTFVLHAVALVGVHK